MGRLGMSDADEGVGFLQLMGTLLRTDLAISTSGNMVVP